jgi:hypothetical protein
MGRQRAERLDHHANPHQRGDVRGIVGRRDLDDLKPANALRADQAQQLQGLARQETAGLRPAGAGNKAAIDRIDIERNIDGVGVFLGKVERDLR